VAELLIVDDEAGFRRPLRRTLERAGHRVLEASDVDAAREILASRSIELILCDVNMPGGSGLELVRSVVQEAPDTAIVMLTGVDDPAVADEALTIGAHCYMVKPVGGNEARILVAASLRHRELELARRHYVEELESKVVSRTAALRDALARLEATEADVRDAERDAVDRLVDALTVRSEETGAHIRRVGRFCAMPARRAGVRLGPRTRSTWPRCSTTWGRSACLTRSCSSRGRSIPRSARSSSATRTSGAECSREAARLC
jgi:cyclic di-GMP phosphodiesterase